MAEVYEVPRIEEQIERYAERYFIQAQSQIDQWHARLDRVLAQGQEAFAQAHALSYPITVSVEETQQYFATALAGLRDDRSAYQEAQGLAGLERRLDGLYREMDQHVDRLGLETLPESYDGHVPDDLYRQVAELQHRVDQLKEAELQQHSPEHGMER